MSEMYEPTVYKVCLGCGAWGDVKCSCKQRSLPEQPDLATRVAADIFVRGIAKTIGEMPNYGDAGDYLSDRCTQTLAGQCVRFGRIFAEAVAKEGK